MEVMLWRHSVSVNNFAYLTDKQFFELQLNKIYKIQVAQIYENGI